MTGGDRGLELVAAGGAQRGGALEHGLRRLDRAAVPQAAVLVAAAAPARPGTKRAAARPCWIVSSAASPHASAWSGQAGRDHPGQPDRVGAEVAVLGADRSRRRSPRCTSGRSTASTSGSRSVEVVRGPAGRCRSMTILRLARTIRWASVRSLTRNARAIWGVVRPMTARRVSGSRASGASAGWQQAKSSASRSSVAGSSSSAESPRRRASRRVARSRRPRARNRSRALRRAAVVQPCAGPVRRTVSSPALSASTTAPCTASSATSKSPGGGTGGPPVDPTPRGACVASSSSLRGHSASFELRCSPRPSAGSRPRRRGTPGAARSWPARSRRPCRVRR